MAAMNARALSTILAVGALTGMRSMVGATLLAEDRLPRLGRLAALGAVGEMMADKTAAVGNRTDPLPLTGRAAFGAAAGVSIAGRYGAHRVLGGVLGAVAAIGAAHAACAARKHLPRFLGGVLEDLLVIGVARRYVTPMAPRLSA